MFHISFCDLVPFLCPTWSVISRSIAQGRCSGGIAALLSQVMQSQHTAVGIWILENASRWKRGEVGSKSARIRQEQMHVGWVGHETDAALRATHGCSQLSMAAMWSCSGCALGLLWGCSGDALVLLWLFSDCALVLLRCVYLAKRRSHPEVVGGRLGKMRCVVL